MGLQTQTQHINLSPIRKAYIDLIHNLRNTGIKVSDRRAVKIQNLLAASALICNREVCIPSDFWVLKYIWDTEEQIEILAGLVDEIIEKDEAPKAHPQAINNKAPNSEELMKEVNHLTQKWDEEELSYEAQNIIKDKLRYLQTRCNWIRNKEHHQHLLTHIDALWKKILLQPTTII